MCKGPSSTTHDPVMKREEYGWRGWWERKGGRWRGGWTCRHLVCGKRGGGKRCGLHANRVPLFSATGVQDSLTKAQQMDQVGPSTPQKKCAVMKTTFFHTKPLCSHGHAWLHVRRRPSMSLHCTQSHTLARAQLVYCLALIIQLFLSFCTHPFSEPPYLCLRGYLHTFRPTHTFLSRDFGKCEAHAKWFTLTSNVLHSLVVKGFCYFVFLQNLTVFQISSSTAQPLCIADPYVLCNGTVPSSEHVWVIVYSREQEIDGKENDMQQNIVGCISVN